VAGRAIERVGGEVTGGSDVDNVQLLATATFAPTVIRVDTDAKDARYGGSRYQSSSLRLKA
jgi:hypothetical protein